MKVLTFGSLKIEINLDEKGEELLVEDIKESVDLAMRDYKWRARNAQTPSNLNETPNGGNTTPKASKKTKRKVK